MDYLNGEAGIISSSMISIIISIILEKISCVELHLVGLRGIVVHHRHIDYMYPIVHLRLEEIERLL